MKKNTNIKTSHETTARKSKLSSKKKYGSKNMCDDHARSKGDCSKLMALHDALQDPVTSREGF